MAYINNEDYYHFTGCAELPDDFDAIMLRCEDIIDQLTQYRIRAQGFNSLAPFAQELVKKAVCAQCEYVMNSGGLESLNGGEAQSMTIGKFSISGPASQPVGCAVSPLAIQYLALTGLLYTGMDVMV